MCLSSFLQKYGFIMKKTLYSLFFVVLVLSFCL
nr:MAG TPA: Frog skin active peptide family signal and propeptide [Caudoviricetes sp.]